jgi:hypothetical protein
LENQPGELVDESGSLVRPYLARSPSVRVAQVAEDPGLAAEVGIRPYFLTKGRTRSFSETVTFETIVVVAPMPSPYITSLRFEQRELCELCREPQSIAEISAKLRMPIAVARVIAGDLSAFGVLDVYSPPEDVVDDIELIDAVIHGLRQL